jgi:hypothetical protein
MSSREAGGIVSRRGSIAEAPDFIYLHVSKYAMVAIAAVTRSEQTKEKKNVAGSDAHSFPGVFELHLSVQTPNVRLRTLDPHGRDHRPRCALW